MTETEFFDFVLLMSWRTNDTELYDALPTLTKAAQGDIARDVQVHVKDIPTTIALTDGVGDLPDGYRIIKSVTDDDGNYYVRFATNVLLAKRPTYGFTIYNDQLILSHGDDTTPPDSVTVVYGGPLEPWYDTVSGDGTGFQSRHSGFYLTAVLKWVYKWLRDDTQSDKEEARYNAQIDQVQSDENRRYWTDANLSGVVPGNVW